MWIDESHTHTPEHAQIVLIDSCLDKAEPMKHPQENYCVEVCTDQRYARISNKSLVLTMYRQFIVIVIVVVVA